MTNTLPLQDWLHVIREEYLDGFIDDGGSALKFVVPVKEDLSPLLKDQFTRDAGDLGYLVVHVDAGVTGSTCCRMSSSALPSKLTGGCLPGR